MARKALRFVSLAGKRRADGRLFRKEPGCLYCAVGIGNVWPVSEKCAEGSRINDHIMELLILISACKMGSAKRITGEPSAETD